MANSADVIMPTFTSITLGRLLEPGTTTSMASDPKLVPRPNGEKYKLNRRNSVTTMPTMEKKVPERKYHWAQITPALYTTPKTTPLPDCSSSFPPSPYIINHKRRGPRLLKSHSVAGVSTAEQALEEVNVNGSLMDDISDVSRVHNDTIVSASLGKSPTEKEHVNGFVNGSVGSKKVADNTVLWCENGFQDGKGGGKDVSNSMITVNGNGFLEENVASNEASSHMFADSDLSTSPLLSLDKDGADGIVDPGESSSSSSNCEVEDDFVAENSVKLPTPEQSFLMLGKLPSEGGGLPPRDFEAELHEMRLSLLLEVEKRKQADDTSNNMQRAWGRIRDELSQAGIVLPLDLTLSVEEERSYSNPKEDLCQQLRVARFVSQSIGMGLAKAEAQRELESQLKTKNFETVRLCDRLNYYETVNREMSQRNQESVELARRLRQTQKTKRRWVWASITAVVTVGSAALAWAYISEERGSSSVSTTSYSQSHGNNPAAN